MRRILTFIVALWFALAPAAAMLTVTELHGFNADSSGGGAPTLTFIGCTDSDSDSTTYTFSSHDVGTEGNRDTIVGIVGTDGATAFSVSSVTVGGASATEVADEDGSQQVNTAIYIVDNPSGTAEDIVVTFSEALNAAVICVWDAKNLSSETAVDFAVDDDVAASALALSLDTSADGIAVGICGVNDGNNRAAAWTGLTEQTEGADVNGDVLNWSAAHLAPTSSATPLSVTCDWDGANNGSSGATASFR